MNWWIYEIINEWMNELNELMNVGIKKISEWMYWWIYKLIDRWMNE